MKALKRNSEEKLTFAGIGGCDDAAQHGLTATQITDETGGARVALPHGRPVAHWLYRTDTTRLQAYCAYLHTDVARTRSEWPVAETTARYRQGHRREATCRACHDRLEGLQCAPAEGGSQRCVPSVSVACSLSLSSLPPTEGLLRQLCSSRYSTYCCPRDGLCGTKVCALRRLHFHVVQSQPCLIAAL